MLQLFIVFYSFFIAGGPGIGNAEKTYQKYVPSFAHYPLTKVNTVLVSIFYIFSCFLCFASGARIWQFQTQIRILRIEILPWDTS